MSLVVVVVTTGFVLTVEVVVVDKTVETVVFRDVLPAAVLVAGTVVISVCECSVGAQAVKTVSKSTTIIIQNNFFFIAYTPFSYYSIVIVCFTRKNTTFPNTILSQFCNFVKVEYLLFE